MTNNSEQYEYEYTNGMALLQHTARATVLKELKKKKQRKL